MLKIDLVHSGADKMLMLSAGGFDEIPLSRYTWNFAFYVDNKSKPVLTVQTNEWFINRLREVKDSSQALNRIMFELSQSPEGKKKIQEHLIKMDDFLVLGMSFGMGEIKKNILPPRVDRNL